MARFYNFRATVNLKIQAQKKELHRCSSFYFIIGINYGVIFTLSISHVDAQVVHVEEVYLKAIYTFSFPAPTNEARLKGPEFAYT